MRLLRLLAAAASIVLFVQHAAAQSVDNSSNGGTPENAVFHGSDLDAVQTNNGSLQIIIPLSSTPGRGISTGWSYVYNNKGWHANSYHDGTTANVQPNLGNSMGWRLVGPIPGAASLATKPVAMACGGVIVGAKIFTVVEADGTRHHMVPDPTLNGGGNFCNWTADSLDHYVDDGSGWVLRGGTTLYRKDGALMGGAIHVTGGSQPQDVIDIPSKITDTNGNQAYGTLNGSTITYTDSLGRIIPAVNTVTDANGNILSQQIPYYDADGTLRNIQVQFVAVSVRTNLCPPTSGGCYEYSGTWHVPQTITLANGLFYSFTYDPVTAELTSMTLPTGARIDYTYAEQFYPYNTRDTGGRSVTQRKLTIDGHSYPWNYSYNLGDSSSSTTVIDPLLNQTTYQCVNMGRSPDTQWDHPPCYTSEVDYYSGNGTGAALLKKVQTDYWASWYAIKPKAVTTTTYSTISGDTSVSKMRLETDYDTFAVSEPTATGDFTHGNVVETREFSYDPSGSSAVLVRRTDFQYQSDQNTQYSNINITDRVADKTVYDCLSVACTPPTSVGTYGTAYSGGRLVAETQTAYDGTAVLNANGNATSVAVLGHDDTNYSTAYTLRGNPTQIKSWLNTSNTWVASNNTFDLLGHIITTTDPGNHTTTFSYSDDWNGWNTTAACLPSANTFAFLTDTTNAKNQHTRTSYFPCTGQVQTVKDPNDVVNNGAGVSFTYEKMKRLTTKTASDGGQTSYSYNDNLADLSTTITTTVTSSLNHVVKTSYDSLGREVGTTLLSDPDGITYADVTYDELGRKKTVSNPYRSRNESTYGITTFVYDVLGRTTMTIPPDGSQFVNNNSTSFGGNYTISKDAAGIQRKRYFDSFGRVVEVDEPGPITIVPTHSTGSFMISGTEQTRVNTPGVSATGSIAISGGVQSRRVCNPDCHYVTDAGDIYATVNGMTKGATYRTTSDNSGTLATTIANAFNSDPNSPVTATASPASGTPATLSLSSRVQGPNYSLAAGTDYDDMDFLRSSFTLTPSGITLTGGVYPTYTYDSGDVSIIIAGYTARVSYGQADTYQSVATALADTLNNDQGAPVTASVNVDTFNLTATINLISKAAGADANYSLSFDSETTQGTFSSPSFTVTTSGSMIGGTQQQGGLSTPYVTLYKYDVLNNLFCVEQHGNITGTSCPASTDPNNPLAPDPNNPWRVREFGYDSLGHLRWSSNPEPGLITFGYDADGNMVSKTSPLPNQTDASTITTTYSYDQLHRPTGRTYSNGDPTIIYGYDAPEGTVVNGLTIHNGIGHRTSMIDGSGSAAWTYDQEGRLKAENKTIGSVSKGIAYSYNLDGSLAAIVYPSGNTVTYTPARSGANTASRVGMVQDLGNSINYVTGSAGVGSYATYASDGSIAGFYNGGGGGFGGIGNTFTYNNRLQPCRSAAGTGTMPSSCADSTNQGNVFDIGYDFHLGNGNNGNVYQLFNYKNSMRSQLFTYDQLNRVSSGKTSSSSAWGTNYTYDAWGNLTQKTPMTGVQSGEYFSQAALANNRLTGFSYDAAGNTTGDGTNFYGYDGENQIISAAGVNYTYDGDGARVKKSSGRLYWDGSPGILAESDLSGNLTAEYIFFDGERVARRDYPSGVVHYYFSDHLKSTSVVTSATGSTEEESDYHTWGEESVITHTLADQHYKFNGKERDSETGFDDFGARLYSSAWGRWLIPDWSANPTPVPYAQMDNPQSLNLYAYVLNNPITLPDADGHYGGILDPNSEGFSQGDDHPQMDEIQEYIARAHAEVAAFQASSQGAATDFWEKMKNIFREGGCYSYPNGCKTDREMEAEKQERAERDKLWLISFYHLDPKVVAAMTPEQAAAVLKGLGMGQTEITAGGKTFQIIAKAVQLLPVIYGNRAAARQAFSGEQQKAANRFFKGATGKSTDFKTTALENGGQRMEFFSPARNPGYGKRYVQEIDANGNIQRWYKDTIGPNGLIGRKWLEGGP